ncbi:hypothetical protein [Nonlabens sp. SY33080]|uniref:hypothetical protein n=1 Tax=Nonlabens sp. SY33080 TaxID=2719911 RepID=UPI001428CB2D|nr:hypothetical protein [Nonlabens sp. SY33080]
MQHRLKYIAFACILIALSSCNPDDDNSSNEEEPVAVNEFTLGDDNYSLEQGYRSQSSEDSPNLFLTNVVLSGPGLTLNSSNVLSGNGDIVGLEFYTTVNDGLQPGTYNLDSLNEQAQTVYAFIGVDYNAQLGEAIIEDEIFSGTITVELLENGDYKITGSGTADDANEGFTISYTGELRLVI